MSLVEKIVPITKNKTYKTRFGYVAYSYENFQKLKKLNLIFQKARNQAAKWERWVRKAPHNRVQKKWLRNEQRQKIGHEVVGPLPEPPICEVFSEKLVDIDRKPINKRWFVGYIKTNDAIEAEYKKARHPQATPERVEECQMSEGSINGLLVQAEAWYNQLVKIPF